MVHFQHWVSNCDTDSRLVVPAHSPPQKKKKYMKFLMKCWACPWLCQISLWQNVILANPLTLGNGRTGVSKNSTGENWSRLANYREADIWQPNYCLLIFSFHKIYITATFLATPHLTSRMTWLRFHKIYITAILWSFFIISKCRLGDDTSKKERFWAKTEKR